MNMQPCANKQQRIEEFEKTHKLLYELMTSYLGEGIIEKHTLILDIDTIERSIVNHVEYTLASTRFNFDDTKAYLATSHRYNSYYFITCSVRDRLIERFNDTNVMIDECNCKRVYIVYEMSYVVIIFHSSS